MQINNTYCITQANTICMRLNNHCLNCMSPAWVYMEFGHSTSKFMLTSNPIAIMQKVKHHQTVGICCFSTTGLMTNCGMIQPINTLMLGRAPFIRRHGKINTWILRCQLQARAAIVFNKAQRSSSCFCCATVAGYANGFDACPRAQPNLPVYLLH